MSTDAADIDVHVIHCETWEHFILAVRNQEEGRVVGPRIYRGQSDPSWPLSSKFERWLHLRRVRDGNRPLTSIFGPSGPDAFEQQNLSFFRHAAIGVPNVQTDSLKEEEWWMLGRHHGLITRLLDWTYSPYIAAFFAFVDFIERSNAGFAEGLAEAHATFETGHVAVYALAPFKSLEVPGEFEIISSRKEAFYRQRAQQGVFTRLRHNMHTDLVPYLRSKDAGYYLERILIPRGEVGKALSDLRLMNITYASLFPDLDGAARDTNMAEGVSGLGWSGIQVRIVT